MVSFSGLTTNQAEGYLTKLCMLPTGSCSRTSGFTVGCIRWINISEPKPDGLNMDVHELQPFQKPIFPPDGQMAQPEDVELCGSKPNGGSQFGVPAEKCFRRLPPGNENKNSCRVHRRRTNDAEILDTGQFIGAGLAAHGRVHFSDKSFSP